MPKKQKPVEIPDNFTKREFESALKKVSRRVEKPKPASKQG